MNRLVDLASYSRGGEYIMLGLLVIGIVLGVIGTVNLVRSSPRWEGHAAVLFAALNLVFIAGFIWTCWFHYQIYSLLPLALPEQMVIWVNNHLAFMNRGSAYGLPLLDPAHPPRYMLPLWIEQEKYYFWFMCYSIMGFIAYRRISLHRLRALMLLVLAAKILVLFFAIDPFSNPLPNFFNEVWSWFETVQLPRQQISLFMRLYPRMIFYYNAGYMWIHPPMLFMSYACLTITFIASVFMLARRDTGVETAGYDFARLGFLLLTVGMLIGYPWALSAWGSNWWWDPKICSSIMMWLIFSTYLHARLYAGRTGMWYFTSLLGILSFLAMIFTFLTSLFFPGEHTSQ